MVDATGGVFGCWQETETVMKSLFLDLVQLVGQEGVPTTNKRLVSTNNTIDMYKCVLSYQDYSIRDYLIYTLGPLLFYLNILELISNLNLGLHFLLGMM